MHLFRPRPEPGGLLLSLTSIISASLHTAYPALQKDEQAAEQLGDTLKQVMEGVKSQAGHIRGTVAQLEDERDRAIRAKDAATKELEVGRLLNYCSVVVAVRLIGRGLVVLRSGEALLNYPGTFDCSATSRTAISDSRRYRKTRFILL